MRSTTNRVFTADIDDDDDDDASMKPPSKPPSAFLCFSKGNRETIRKENAGLTFAEIGKLLGERWKNMPPEDKEVAVVQNRSGCLMISEKMSSAILDLRT